MKNNKFITNFFTRRSAANLPALITLTSGLAAGAVLGVLFTSESGRRLRERIVRNLAGLVKVSPAREVVQKKIHYHGHSAYKKPESDSRNLIHQPYTEEAHTEQGFSI
jgi:uncharacterized membrane protein YebE (DUF533 family)